MRLALNTIRSIPNDPQFVAEHQYQPADLIRKRTLTFERVALSMFGGPIASLRNGADALCQGLGPKGVPVRCHQAGPVESLSEVSLQGP